VSGKLSTRKIILVVSSLSLLICLGCCVAVWLIKPGLPESFAFSFTDGSPEQLFREYVLGYEVEMIPAEVTEIDGVEMAVFGYHGPAYLRFRADEEYVEELLTRDYQSFEPYSVIPCADFEAVCSDSVLGRNLIEEYPERFEWWKPSEVTQPICYHSQGPQSDASKYLLVDLNSDVVYFHHTATCGLCPD
jgi:hypothetical protein